LSAEYPIMGCFLVFDVNSLQHALGHGVDVTIFFNWGEPMKIISNSLGNWLQNCSLTCVYFNFCFHVSFVHSVNIALESSAVENFITIVSNMFKCLLPFIVVNDYFPSGLCCSNKRYYSGESHIFILL
jgi:hypothetical protein